MGYGVYDSDFDGTGGTFLVSGPIPTEEGYAAYVADCRSDGDEPLPEDAWREQECEDFESDLDDALRGAVSDIGLTLAKRTRGSYPRAGFDEDFTLRAEGDQVAVGLRQWQHDYVIGVAASARMAEALADPEGEAATFLETGRLPEAYKAIYDGARDAVQDYVRLRMMQDGFECRFRTSGYTSGTYEKPEDMKAAMAEALNAARAGLRRLDQQPDDALRDLDAAGRVAYLSAVREAGGEPPFPVAVPLFEAGTRTLHLLVPGEPDTGFTRTPTPAEMAWLSGLPTDADGNAPLPDAPEAAALVSRIQGSEYHLVVTAHEYAAATGEECEVSWDGGECSLVLAEPPAGAPRP